MTEEQVFNAYVECGCNIQKTLCKLWDVKEEAPKERSDAQAKWDRFRTICDEFDNAVQGAFAKPI